MALSLALTAPFFVAFIMIPDFIMRGIFVRGAFTLRPPPPPPPCFRPMASGIIAIVLLRSAVASFQAVGDTRTPMLISLTSVAINVGLKLVLFKPFGAPGLASATAFGAWVNLVLLAIFAIRRGSMKPDLVLWKTATCVSTASCALAFFALLAAYPVQRLAAHFGRLTRCMELLLLGAGGALVYGAIMIAGLRIAGVELRRSARAKAEASEPPYGW